MIINLPKRIGLAILLLTIVLLLSGCGQEQYVPTPSPTHVQTPATPKPAPTVVVEPDIPLAQPAEPVQDQQDYYEQEELYQDESPQTQSNVDVSTYSILGAWKQTFGAGDWDTYNGRIVQFNDTHQCNLFSPLDTYGISGRDNVGFSLSITGLLGGNLTYWVKPIDENNIEIYLSNNTDPEFKLLRLE